MESKHTPGPWAINHDINAMNVCRDEPFTDICVCYGAAGRRATPSISEGKANAKLIAAAPALLAACKAARECLRQHERLGHVKSDPRWDAIDAAIAQAEGADQ